jgi:hypothetical protein
MALKFIQSAESCCGKVVLLHAMLSLRREEYSSCSFLTSAVDGVSGQRHSPAAFYLRERTPVPTGMEAGWASEFVWTQRLEENPFVSAGYRTTVVQSVVRHCADWTTPSCYVENLFPTAKVKRGATMVARLFWTGDWFSSDSSRASTGRSTSVSHRNVKKKVVDAFYISVLRHENHINRNI